MQIIFSIVVAYFAAQAFGPDVNSWWYGPYRNQHDFFGYVMAFMPAVLVAGIFLWPIALKAWQDNVIAPFHSWRVRSDGRPSLTREQINQGETLTYAGRIDRPLPYMQSGWKKKGRIQHTFEISRNTMAMQKRERTALLILETLDRKGAIPAELADRSRFALTWGNGESTITKFPNLTADRDLLGQNGVKEPNDLIRLEASYRSANVGAVISELFAALQAAARQRGADEEVKALLSRLTPPLDEVG